MTETLYTLTAAARELARRECRMVGHSWDVIQTIGAGPTAVVCDRCGDTYAVVREVREAGATRGREELRKQFERPLT